MTRIWQHLPIAVLATTTAANAQVSVGPSLSLSAAMTPDQSDVIRPARAVRDHQFWLRESDFPAEAFSGLSDRRVWVELEVNADDTVGQCIPDDDSDSAILGPRVCQLLRERGRFVHALDSAGAASRGRVRMLASFGQFPRPFQSGMPMPAPPMPIRVRGTPPAPFDATLLKLPRDPTVFLEPTPSARVDIDVEGQVTRCQIFGSTGTDLGDIALCRRLKDVQFQPARDAEGKSISVRNHYIWLTVAQ